MAKLPVIYALLHQDLLQSYPYPPLLMEVSNYKRSVILCRSEEFLEVPEGLHRIQWLSLCPESFHCSCPCLPYRQPPYFPFCDTCADSSGGMEVVEFHPTQKHFTLSVTGLCMFPLLQNRNRVLHGSVHKVNPEVGPRFFAPPTALRWAPSQPIRSR